MCGRFTLMLPRSEVIRLLRCETGTHGKPSWNIVPSNVVADAALEAVPVVAYLPSPRSPEDKNFSSAFRTELRQEWFKLAAGDAAYREVQQNAPIGSAQRTKAEKKKRKKK